MGEVKLLPCPFCGGEPERIDVPYEDDVDGGMNAGGSCIQCKRCAASTGLHFDRKENLYSSWNERAKDTALADKIEALIAEFGDDPKAALECVSEHVSLRRHYAARAESLPLSTEGEEGR